LKLFDSAVLLVRKTKVIPDSGLFNRMRRRCSQWALAEKWPVSVTRCSQIGPLVGSLAAESTRRVASARARGARTPPPSRPVSVSNYSVCACTRARLLQAFVQRCGACRKTHGPSVGLAARRSRPGAFRASRRWPVARSKRRQRSRARHARLFGRHKALRRRILVSGLSSWRACLRLFPTASRSRHR